jgi:hypothetical protein
MCVCTSVHVSCVARSVEIGPECGQNVEFVDFKGFIVSKTVRSRLRLLYVVSYI